LDINYLELLLYIANCTSNSTFVSNPPVKNADNILGKFNTKSTTFPSIIYKQNITSFVVDPYYGGSLYLDRTDVMINLYVCKDKDYNPYQTCSSLEQQEDINSIYKAYQGSAGGSVHYSNGQITANLDLLKFTANINIQNTGTYDISLENATFGGNKIVSGSIKLTLAEEGNNIKIKVSATGIKTQIIQVYSYPWGLINDFRSLSVSSYEYSMSIPKPYNELELSISETLIGGYGGISSSNITVTNRSFGGASTKNYTLEVNYGNTTKKYPNATSVIFPDGFNINELFGIYNVQAYYDDDPTNIAQGSINVVGTSIGSSSSTSSTSSTSSSSTSSTSSTSSSSTSSGGDTSSSSSSTSSTSTSTSSTSSTSTSSTSSSSSSSSSSSGEPSPPPTPTPSPDNDCKSDIKKVNNDVDSLQNEVNELLSLTNFIQNNIQQDQVNELSFSNKSFSIKSNTECGNVTNCDDVMPAFYSLDLSQYEMSEADKIINQITDIAIEQVSFNILTGGLGSLASLSGKLAIYVLSKPAVKEFLIKATHRLNSFKISDNICPTPAYAGNISSEVTKGKNFLKDIFDKAKDYIKSVGKSAGNIHPLFYKNVPSSLRSKIDDGFVDLSKFTQRMNGGKLKDPKTGYFLSKDKAVNSGTGTHGGSYWKLENSIEKRVGTLSQDGKFLRG
jgi:hypothetical protein